MSDAPERAGGPAPEPPAGTGAGTETDTEEYTARGVWGRAAFPIGRTHLFGAFVRLLVTVAD